VFRVRNRLDCGPGSSVKVVTKLQSGQHETRDSIPGRGRRFTFCASVFRAAQGRTGRKFPCSARRRVEPAGSFVRLKEKRF
jgi:hypothetical protein